MVDSERKSRSAIRALLSPSPTRPSISLWREERMVRGEEGNPVYWQGILTDITERKTLEERLRHRAFHDSLTGLPNRPLFLWSPKAWDRRAARQGAGAGLRPRPGSPLRRSRPQRGRQGAGDAGHLERWYVMRTR